MPSITDPPGLGLIVTLNLKSLKNKPPLKYIKEYYKIANMLEQLMPFDSMSRRQGDNVTDPSMFLDRDSFIPARNKERRNGAKTEFLS